MKKTMIMMAAAIALTACQNDLEAPEASETAKTITFRVHGDFTLTTSSMTRALSTDGRDMTDVWVLDYVGDELKQQIHQTTEDEGFGAPTLSLELGSHTLYFVASRCAEPTLNTSSHILSFGKVYDTFWKSLYLDITSGGTESRNIMLDRIVTKLRLTFTDAVPNNTASINLTPGTWYYGFDYKTSAPAAAKNNEMVTIAVPSSTYGQENQSANLYGFSAATEWTTSLAVKSLDTDGNTIGSVSFSSVPLLRNRQTIYTGKFWNSVEGMAMSLNADWLDAYEGTW